MIILLPRLVDQGIIRLYWCTPSYRLVRIWSTPTFKTQSEFDAPPPKHENYACKNKILKHSQKPFRFVGQISSHNQLHSLNPNQNLVHPLNPGKNLMHPFISPDQNQEPPPHENTPSLPVTRVRPVKLFHINLHISENMFFKCDKQKSS